jgi:hypothetical protein
VDPNGVVIKQMTKKELLTVIPVDPGESFRLRKRYPFLRDK